MIPTTATTHALDARYEHDGGSVIHASVDDAVNWLLNWGRANSVWYLLFGLACCAIELMQTGGPRGDLERFGSAPRPSPRSSDLLIVAGTLTYKMALRVKRLYDQMSEPKYVISMGSCSNCGGLFQYAYSVCKGVDNVIPVDVYVPGCPPRPEALLEGLLKIQEKIKGEKYLQKRYGVAAPQLAPQGVRPVSR
jgi:NADH-quinone oxidoreductase subunit B